MHTHSYMCVCTDMQRHASLHTCTRGHVYVLIYTLVYTRRHACECIHALYVHTRIHTETHACECIHAQIMASNILLPDLRTAFCSSSHGDVSGSLLGTGTASVTDTNHVGLTVRLGCAWGLPLCGDGSQSELSPRNHRVQTPTVSLRDGRTGRSSPDASGPCRPLAQSQAPPILCVRSPGVERSWVSHVAMSLPVELPLLCSAKCGPFTEVTLLS